MNEESLHSGVMKDAEIDLAGNISGRFSPENWKAILERAKATLEAQVRSGKPEGEAWTEVIREFHRDHYWGFEPNYHAPKLKKKPNLGLGLIFILATSFTLVKIAIVWLGQIYTFSDEENDGRIFYVALVIVLANFAFFLWRFRRHTD